MKCVLHTITFNRDIHIIYYHTPLSTMSNYLDLSTSVRMPEPNYIPTFAGSREILQSPWSQIEREPRHIHAIYEQFNCTNKHNESLHLFNFISFNVVTYYPYPHGCMYVDLLLYENLSLKRPKWKSFALMLSYIRLELCRSALNSGNTLD